MTSRLAIVTCSLLSIACRSTANLPDPIAQQPDATPEPVAPIEHLDARPPLIGTGRAVVDATGVALELDAATVLRITGDGTPCDLDDAPVLIAFEGPEAFALLGARPPRIVALQGDSIRCWPASSTPHGQDADLGAQLLEVVRDSQAEAPSHALQARTTLELLPMSAGIETIELDLRGDDDSRLRVTAADGTRLLDWSGVTLCEDHKATVWARRVDSATVLVIDEDCDDCRPCDHAEIESSTRDHLWWPDGERAFFVVTNEFWDHHAAPTAEGGEILDHDNSRESWQLGEGLLHHDRSETATTYYEETCTGEGPTFDCCHSQTDDEAVVESWTFEPPSGKALTSIVEQHQTSQLVYDQCK